LFCCGVSSVCLGQTPPNDNFTNAIPLYGNSVIFTGTLVNATYEPGESQRVDRFFEGGSVWWSWTATNSTRVVISMVPQDTTNYYAYAYCAFAVHSATNVTDITDDSQLDWNFVDVVYPAGYNPHLIHRYVSFPATAGTTYYIRALGNPAGPLTLRLTATNSPVILAPPQEQTVPESASAFFSVFAAGLRPLKYQWQFNGSNLAGQTSPCLALHDLGANQAGGYAVVVSNATGVVTSSIANLTVSPTNQPLVLQALGLSASNKFVFSITGETQIGRFFRVWASTNLINWSDEESLFPDYCDCHIALVSHPDVTSVYSVPMSNPRKFLRVSRYMDREICIAHLEQIKFAIKLWAAETKHNIGDPVTEVDITPYLTGNPIVCPSGGTTFVDSYILTYVPLCMRIPASHVLP